MTELSPTYFTEDQQASKDAMTVTVTFSLTVYHVGLLSWLSHEKDTNKSLLVRKMIEATYKNPTIIETQSA